jgi:hypothetical protein
LEKLVNLTVIFKAPNGHNRFTPDDLGKSPQTDGKVKSSPPQADQAREI